MKRSTVSIYKCAAFVVVVCQNKSDLTFENQEIKTHKYCNYKKNLNTKLNIYFIL